MEKICIVSRKNAWQPDSTLVWLNAAGVSQANGVVDCSYQKMLFSATVQSTTTK